MKLFFNQVSLIAIVAMTFLLGGCDKTKPYNLDVAPPRAHFIGSVNKLYNVIDNPAPSFTFQIGTTDVSSADRVVSYNISSPSGATAGNQYTISPAGSVTIPANGSLADVTIQANYAAYASGRRDTLIFSIATPSLAPTAFLDTIKVVLAGPSGCSEGNPDLPSLVGSYPNTNEVLATNPPYGPYTTAVSSVTSTGPTSATAVVENIWDNGWGPISFNLDWSDPTNPTAIVVQQDAIPGSDAGDLNATYAGQTIAVRVPSAALSATPGSYASCVPQTFVLKMQLGVTGVGYFNALYTVTLLRN